MKKNTFIFTCLTLALVAGFSSNRASAQIFASDDAGAYTTWTNGQNAGFGFEPWVFYNTGLAGGATGFAGTFRGNGGDPVDSANGNYWGTFANSATTASTEEFRAFSNSLPVNATFKIRWHNTGIGNTDNNAGGFSLRNGDSTNLQNAATFLNDNPLFALYYVGGISDNYRVFDGNGVNPIPVNFSTGNNNGLMVEVTLLPNSMYNMVVENAAGTTVYWSTNDQPLAASGTIDSFAMFAFDTDGNQNFNDPEIFLLAPQIQNLTPANGATYVPAGSQLSFAVTSSASTISSNQIQLILNGVAEAATNLTDTGSGTSSNEIVLNTPLQGNQLFNGTVIATDASGNTSTNTFSFNTWLTEPNNIYIEAGDYNYGAGQWINNFTTAEPNQNYGQFDLLGTNNIDYFVFDFAFTNNPAQTLAPPRRCGHDTLLQRRRAGRHAQTHRERRRSAHASRSAQRLGAILGAPRLCCLLPGLSRNRQGRRFFCPAKKRTCSFCWTSSSCGKPLMNWALNSSTARVGSKLRYKGSSTLWELRLSVLLVPASGIWIPNSSYVTLTHHGQTFVLARRQNRAGHEQ